MKLQSKASRTKISMADGCQEKESNPNDGIGSLESMEGQMSMRKKATDKKQYQSQSLETTDRWPRKNVRVHPSQSGESQ